MAKRDEHHGLERIEHRLDRSEYKLNLLLRGQQVILHALHELAEAQPCNDGPRIAALSKKLNSHAAELSAVVADNPLPPET